LRTGSGAWSAIAACLVDHSLTLEIIRVPDKWTQVNKSLEESFGDINPSLEPLHPHGVFGLGAPTFPLDNNQAGLQPVVLSGPFVIMTICKPFQDDNPRVKTAHPSPDPSNPAETPCQSDECRDGCLCPLCHVIRPSSGSHFLRPRLVLLPAGMTPCRISPRQPFSVNQDAAAQPRNPTHCADRHSPSNISMCSKLSRYAGHPWQSGPACNPTEHCNGKLGT
jgi:hypothetical protein